MVVYCTYCGQRFTRDEHLERHILTHTNVKPFKCLSCHMSFARRDLLQRHYTVHGKDQNNQEIIPAANGLLAKSAGRTPIACSNCAKTKTKCDKKFPCSRCAARSLKCTMRPTRRATKQVARVSAPVDNAADGAGDESSGGVEQSVRPGESSRGVSLQDGVAAASPSPSVPVASVVEEKVLPTPPTLATPIGFSNPPPLPLSGSTPAMSPRSSGPPHFLSLQTPQSSYSGLPQLPRDDTDSVTSPHFMLDWNQMQMPLGFDGALQPQMLMTTAAGFDPTIMTLTSAPTGNQLTILPNTGHEIPPPLITPPMEFSKFDQPFEIPEYSNSPFTESQRPVSSRLVPEHQRDIEGEMVAVIAARDGWSCFRCVPTIPSSSCPKTARLNLERLERTLKAHDVWTTWTPQWDEADFVGGDYLTVMQLHESTRDKLLAITQSFLHKALEIHRDNTSLQSHSYRDYGASNFILLPPARVLEYFLRSYANCFERFYPLTARGTLDANEMMHCYNDRAASLLVLMMLAQGAMTIPSTEARMLTGGLTEACRISLFDHIERNITVSGDPIVLQAALIFTVQAAWSGDKWQMDIAMGRRGMYLAMLRHSGVLESRSGQMTASGHRANVDQLWREWIQDESRSSLVYSWALVDQELALFHDTAPLLSTTELGLPMPDSERLWHAKTAREWSTVFEQVHEFTGGYSSVGSGARPMSLRDLFRCFLTDQLVSLGIEMTPLQLRLLLHPLHVLVYQCNQLLAIFPPLESGRTQGPSALSPSSTRARLFEAQSLLQRWFDLAERYLKTNSMCSMMQTNLIIFHLLSLNAVTDFANIEVLARRDDLDNNYQLIMWAHKRCISDTEEAIFHCGQILRLIRSMSGTIRPPWWTGAVYRVALVLWTDSLTRREQYAAAQQASENSSEMFPVPGPSFAIDALTAEHPLIIRYLTKREGVPCLTKQDGTQMPVDSPFHVLSHCISVLDEGAATRFSDGIRAKLERLATMST